MTHVLAAHFLTPRSTARPKCFAAGVLRQGVEQAGLVIVEGAEGAD
jgi:hypothetical protein